MFPGLPLSEALEDSADEHSTVNNIVKGEAVSTLEPLPGASGVTGRSEDEAGGFRGTMGTPPESQARHTHTHALRY